MSQNPCQAMIRGLPDYPDITEVNVRSGPGTNQSIAFKGQVGMSGLAVLEVAPDSQGLGDGGKVYQWFKLTFHGGAIGWVRDDLLEIEGDCSAYGYGTLDTRKTAFDLKRTETVSDRSTAKTAPLGTTSDEASKPAEPAAPSTTATDLERVKKASFAVTAAFEGTGYAAYNNYDAGVVSYGLIQFTLAAGSLFTVVARYLDDSQSKTAEQLRPYYERIRNRDGSLREDATLKSLLIDAAQEPEMQQAQDYVATVNYWDKVVDGYIAPRGLKLPLSYALLFDMGVNFGTGHGFVRLAEEQLGVPSRSRPGENGITEEQLIRKVAELRRDSHYRQAERDNLPGLKVRGDFWIERVEAGDWSFAGDTEGVVSINGRRVVVRTV